MPKSRANSAKVRDKQLEIELHGMLEAGERISARAVARKMGVATSSVTRDSRRMSLITQAIEKQNQEVAWQARSAKESKSHLVKLLSEKELQIKELQGLVDTLQASHKAMILAVGEFGGMAAWQKFFARWNDFSADVISIEPKPK